MIGKNYEIGSVWRRWDLHIHTPETKKNPQFKGATNQEKWDNYIADINAYKEDIAVVGVTDYVCADNYFKFKQLIADGKITKSFDLVVPNVELRISPVTGDSIPINIHCIFNPAFDNEIEKRFFQKLKFEYKGRTYDASKSDLRDLGRAYKNDPGLEERIAVLDGIKQYVVPFTELKSIFDHDVELRSNTIIIVANGKDGVGGLKDHAELIEGIRYESLDATRQNIYTFSDAVFSSNEGDRKYFLGQKKNAKDVIIDDEKEVMRKCGTLMPCFHGCDAHDNAKIFEPDNKSYCWVKADPSFEGIKQVLFEPAERITVDQDNPTLNFDKPVFTGIRITGNVKVLDSDNSKLSFTQTDLPLNRGMTSIIGGRGKGKSMLINYLGYGLSKEITEKLRSKIRLDSNFSVSWQQGSESSERNFPLDAQKELPFTFIYQSKIKEIADDNDALKKEIIDILSGAGFQKPISSVDELEVKETLQKYWNIKEWLLKAENGKLVNDKTAISRSIEQVKEKIDLVTEGSNKKLLEDYVSNLKNQRLLLEENARLKRLRLQILDFKKSINDEISDLGVAIPEIDTIEQQRAIVKLYKENLRAGRELEEENNAIKEDNFQDYKGDLSQLLNNLANYQKEIIDLQRQLDEVGQQERELEETKGKLDKINKVQSDALADEATLISHTWQNSIFNNPERGKNENELIQKLLDDRNVDIRGTIFFNLSAFYATVEKYIDGRSLKPKTLPKILELLEINDQNASQDILTYTIDKIERIKAANPGCFYEGEEYDVFKVFTDPALRGKYMHVFADITVDGNPLDELSAGQKGTVYLCLKLATQLFSGPIIFDQPEDDLDNDFITNELIGLFKEIKKYRQVIIVSHNANLVVNADSEQVIIADNQGEYLSYSSGALENEIINKEICKILEGGERAFEKRRDKYRYVK